MKTIIYVNGTEKYPDRRKLSGIQDYAGAHGWNLQSVECLESAADIQAHVKLWAPAGFIVNRAGNQNMLPPSAFGGIPVVLFEHPVSRNAKDAIRIYNDSAATAAVAVKELLSLNFESYAYVNWFSPTSWSIVRQNEFKRLVSLYGKRCAVFKPGETTANKVVSELADWLKTMPIPLGVFAANDFIAVHIASACRLLGLSVPNDVAIIGVDNDVELCEGHSPSLSSIELDYVAAGRIAAEVLDEFMQRRGGKSPTTMMRSYPPGPVVRRESTRIFARKDKQISAAVELIRKEACNGITALNVLAAIPCSRRMAEIRFRTATGHSILEEILSVRMDKAKQLLSQRNPLPIDVIANRCGYKSTAAFSKAFHDKNGMPPTVWRRLLPTSLTCTA